MIEELRKTNKIGLEIEPKQETFNARTEQARAQRFWETRLKNELRIESPQNLRCECAIVVPVYNEDRKRILRQIESLKNQQNVGTDTFEVIYVINNDAPDASQKSKEVIAANQDVIETLRNVSGLNIFVIDKSSPGKEIKECNVGRARNRGIAEASMRFHENRKNGILIQTDADCYFEDPDYLKRVMEISRENPDMIGIAGGLIFEFDPDTSDPREIKMLKEKLAKFTLKRQWEYMSLFLRNPESPLLFQGNSFSGANMISKSFETAVLGGVDDTRIASDVNFGENLKTYAAGRGQTILEMRKELLVVTALRESDRTGASFKKDFDEIDLKEQLVGYDPLAPSISEIRQKIVGEIDANIHNPDGLRKVLSDENGDLLCSEDGFEKLIIYLGSRQKIDINEKFFADWRQKYFGESDPIQNMYDRLYPKISITHETLRALELKILEHPGGKRFIDDLHTDLTKIRMKQG